MSTRSRSALSKVAIGKELGQDDKTVGNWISEKSQGGAFSDPPDSAVYSDLWSFQSDRDDGKASYFGKTPLSAGHLSCGSGRRGQLTQS